MRTWPSSPPKPIAALDHVAVDDHAAAEAGADDGGDRGLAAIGAEEGEVAPERAGIAVVEVGDGRPRRSSRFARIS